jgi:2'-5' RNA ligase
MIAGSIRLIGLHRPDAFHVALDQAVVRKDRVLLAASRQPEGMRRCQRRLLEAYRAHGLELPVREAAPHAHLTLGYDGSGMEPGMRPIDPISWRVTHMELVLSHRGETRHETLAAWPLPETAAAIAA